MFRKAFIVLAAVAFAGAASASGVGPNSATLSKDKRFTTVHRGSSHYAPSIKPPKKLKVIFDNIGFLYPKGRYFCCFGDTISGPDSQVGQTVWPATEFTPAKSGKIELINVAVGWVSGTNKVIINIAEDDGGVPGTVLGTASATGLGTFGDCCQIAEANVNIPVTAGTPYWIYLSTDESNADTWAAWPFNSTDEVDPMTVAGYNGSSWTNFGSGVPALSFALYGKLKKN